MQQAQKQVARISKAQAAMQEAGGIERGDGKIEQLATVVGAKPRLAGSASLIQMRPVLDGVCRFGIKLPGSMESRSAVIGGSGIDHQLRLPIQAQQLSAKGFGPLEIV